MTGTGQRQEIVILDSNKLSGTKKSNLRQKSLAIRIACMIILFVLIACNFSSQTSSPKTISPTSTSIPMIQDTDLDNICTNEDDIEIGYVNKEVTKDIGQTQFEEKYKNNIVGYYETRWEAYGRPSIVCQMLLYTSTNIASVNFLEFSKEATQGLKESFALEDYGDEGFGYIIPVEPLLYKYVFRSGRIIGVFYIISYEEVDYESINKIVNSSATRLIQFNTR